MSALARIALRWITVALFAASGLMLLTLALTRLAPEVQANQTLLLQVQQSSMAMPLDARGVGAQAVGKYWVSASVAPFPPRAGELITVTVIALEPRERRVMPISPTLEVASLTEVDGVMYPMQPIAGGGYAARDVVLPQPGDWRLRVMMRFAPQEDYSLLMLLSAQ